MLKLFGYHGGRYVVDSLVDYYRAPEPVPEDITRVPPERRARAALHLRIGAAIVALTAPFGDPRVDQFTLLADRLDSLAHTESERADQAAVELLQQAGEQVRNMEPVERNTGTRRAS